VGGVADLPAEKPRPPIFSNEFVPPPPTDIVGHGDILEISIYETGIALFGGVASQTLAGGSFDPAAKVERLPASRVSDQGTINIPFVGELRVAGLNTRQVAKLIRNSLKGMSQNPEVLVSIREGLTNSVIIGGDVARPGRLVLPTNLERLSDVIALAGGNKGEVKDIQVRIQRDGLNAEFRLSDIMSGPDQDLRVFPADRISLVKLPRSFSVMGAPGKVDQVPFSGPRVSLAEAIAQAGGANPNMGDPQAVFLFRFETNEDGKDEPIVYHLNMMKAGSFFLAQKFNMADKDILYFGNAEANQPSKLVQIISQLFAPIVTVQSVANF
jgi:polysaccharide export outer membrane protein